MGSEDKDTSLTYVSMSETPTYIGRPQLVHLMNDRESAVPFFLPLSLTSHYSAVTGDYIFLFGAANHCGFGGREGGSFLPSFVRLSVGLSVHGGREAAMT